MKKTDLQNLKTQHAAAIAEHSEKPSAETQTRIKMLESKISDIENPKAEKPQTKKD